MSKKAVEQDDAEEDLPNVQPPEGIVAFNELRSCADLMRLYQDGSLEIKPDFQRDLVWVNTEQGRFIDSLTKQLPIPSMCFSLDGATETRQVIDGLQRMSSIVKFLDPIEAWRLPKLKDIDPLLGGYTNHEIRDGTNEQKVLYRRVQNLSIPLTVIRCNSKIKEHSEYLFTIFSRLNSGGQKLNKQEIRNCVFSGPLNDLLKELDGSDSWMQVKGHLPGKGKRFRSRETILRFFALTELVSTQRLAKFKGSLPSHLNDFMRANRFLKAHDLDGLRKKFLKVSEQCKRINFTADVPVTYALIEAALVGIHANLNSVKAMNDIVLTRQFEKLSYDHALSGSDAKTDTSSVTKVRDRVQAAIKVFK